MSLAKLDRLNEPLPLIIATLYILPPTFNETVVLIAASNSIEMTASSPTYIGLFEVTTMSVAILSTLNTLAADEFLLNLSFPLNVATTVKVALFKGV